LKMPGVCCGCVACAYAALVMLLAWAYGVAARRF
jgi:hypothetical protein